MIYYSYHLPYWKVDSGTAVVRSGYDTGAKSYISTYEPAVVIPTSHNRFLGSRIYSLVYTL